MRSFIAVAALAALANAQDTTSSSTFTFDAAIPTDPAETLDFAALDAIAAPTYTETPGLASQVVPYVTATAISEAAAAVTEDPLSVFPAATDVPMNTNGQANKRSLNRRTACQPEPTIPNYLSIDVSSAAAFKADQKIANTANNAGTPAGYYQNFKNAPGANSAMAYMGYDQVKTYDVNTCAQACTKKAGCLAFNIYFERDPVVEPSVDGDCNNPDAFANIKCSYWGTVLDSNTANNYGQMRGDFEVAIAGSNAYTSSTTGGPIDGCANPPLFLDTATMNAPLRDCAGTWTYMGYKLYTTGPYEPRLCKAACDAQTDYNRKHAPTDGTAPAVCSAFGSYVLTKTDPTGSVQQGQMCTMYTSSWGAKYAVNKASFNDAVKAKYTYSLSYFYTIPSLQPKGPQCSAAKRDVTPSRLFRL